MPSASPPSLLVNAVLEIWNWSPRLASKPTALFDSSSSRLMSASGRGLPPGASSSTATDSRFRRGPRATVWVTVFEIS